MLKILYNKFTKGKINEFLRQNNIANSAEELTISQARYLAKFKDIDSIRIKFSQTRSAILGERSQEKRNQSLLKDNNLSSISTHGVRFAKEPGDKVSGNNDKLYQRSYDLAHRYGVNIGESKYRPPNAIGVYFNYGSKKG